MAKLKSDSPIARRIVRAFLDFLSSVEPAPGVDAEGIEVAKECLNEAFKMDSSVMDGQIKPDFLVNLFSSLQDSHHEHNELNIANRAAETDILRPSSSQVTVEAAPVKMPKSLDEDQTHESDETAKSKDELFEQFLDALHRSQYFKDIPNGNHDTVQLDIATTSFYRALTEMETAGCRDYNESTLAETLKSQGNRAMQSNLFHDAIKLYSCAIALSGNNAIYYSNRAAAHTRMNNYDDAIADSLRSIEINPKYWKAYSRLGIAYYELGRYRDAIEKGFKKALELDPENVSVKENIRVAEQKLNEESHQREHSQNTSSSSHNNEESNNHHTSGSNSHAAPPPFTSFPFDPNALPGQLASMFMNMSSNNSNSEFRSGSTGNVAPPPFSFSFDSSTNSPNISSMFMNMASNGHDGQQQQDWRGDDTDHGFDAPEIGLGGNIGLNFGEMPEDISQAMRNVMQMFTGATPPGESQQDGTDRRSAPS